MTQWQLVVHVCVDGTWWKVPRVNFCDGCIVQPVAERTGGSKLV